MSYVCSECHKKIVGEMAFCPICKMIMHASSDCDMQHAIDHLTLLDTRDPDTKKMLRKLRVMK